MRRFLNAHAALAVLAVLLNGCGKQPLGGVSGPTPAAPAKKIPVEEVADRLVSELVLFHTIIRSNNHALVASLAGRMELSLEDRFARAWASSNLLSFFTGDTRDEYGGAGMIGLVNSINAKILNKDDPEFAETVKSQVKKIRFQTTEAARQAPGQGNPLQPLYREELQRQERRFNLSLDEAGARVLVARERQLTGRILGPQRPKLPGLREKLVSVLQENPELLATMREAMEDERAMPDDLRESREKADTLITQARETR
jgi:hypothetical protein